MTHYRSTCIPRRAFVAGAFAAFAAAAFGCSAQSGSSSASGALSIASSTNSASPSQEQPGKTLVVCWSQTGNTRAVAQHVVAITGADYYEIAAETPYTQADLDYHDESTRATVEQKEALDTRPAIAGELPDLTPYGTVFIAHPIWWGKAPRIVLTFLENVDLSGKTAIEFVTSGSSGIEGAEDEVRAAAPDAQWLPGKRFPIGADRTDVATWIDSLGMSAVAAGQDKAPAQSVTTSARISIGEHELVMELADNSSAVAFAELLADGPVTVAMSDYGSFEKVGALPQILPTNDEQITTEPGDVILYQGDKITIYYDVNSWNFTRLGKVVDVSPDELREILGEGDIEATFSLAG